MISDYFNAYFNLLHQILFTLGRKVEQKELICHIKKTLTLSELIPDKFVLLSKQFIFAADKIDKNEFKKIKSFKNYSQKHWL